MNTDQPIIVISEDNKINTAKIEIALTDLYLHTKIKDYLGYLISEAIKNIIRTKYGEIESMVIDEIFKKDTRILVESMIKEKLEKEIELHIKDMFGDKNETPK